MTSRQRQATRATPQLLALAQLLATLPAWRQAPTATCSTQPQATATAAPRPRGCPAQTQQRRQRAVTMTLLLPAAA
jgi:hypothetical protein